MRTRRQFLGSLAAPAAVATVASLRVERALAAARDFAKNPGSAEHVARDEDFWREVQHSFTVDRSLVNLNNGGVSPSPTFVQEAMKRHLDYSNEAPAYTMWRILEPQRESVRERMASEWGVDAEEIAFTRNSSESLQICQLGFDLRRGDEVLACTHDYPRMITTFKQRERREGIVLRQLKLPIPAEDPAALVRLYEENLTPATKLMLLSHVVNITGQIMPVREIVAMARKHGVPVIVDGAHALAHFDFDISDLECDYYGVSLHKWLFAPHGTGLLYVRKSKISSLWPMMAAGPDMDANVRKFEEVGTHPAANVLAIADALTFHQGIGGQRKEARLRHLRDTWAKRLLAHDRVTLHTSLKPEFSCAIGTVQVEGVDCGKLADWLWDKHRILVVGIKHPEFEGIRVTASVYTTMEEIDRFGDAMETVIKNGLPA